MDADFLRQMASADAVAAAPERQAALALHGMAPADRAWLLERLTSPRRAELRQLLDELRALGVPREPHWLDALWSPAGESSAPSMPARMPLDALHRLSATQARELLAGEPDRLIASVLRLGPFAWQPALLASLGARRGCIESLLQAPLGAALAQTLVRELAKRAARLPAAPVTAPVPRGAWARLFQRRRKSS